MNGNRRIRYLRNLTIIILYAENIRIRHLTHRISLRIGDVIAGRLPIEIGTDGSSSTQRKSSS